MSSTVARDRPRTPYAYGNALFHICFRYSLQPVAVQHIRCGLGKATRSRRSALPHGVRVWVSDQAIEACAVPSGELSRSGEICMPGNLLKNLAGSRYAVRLTLSRQSRWRQAALVPVDISAEPLTSGHAIHVCQLSTPITGYSVCVADLGRCCCAHDVVNRHELQTAA